MAQTLHNNVFTKLAASLSNSATSISLLDGSGFPTPAVGDFYFATLVSISGSTGKEDDWEIVKVTGKPATNTLTVTRGQEGTAARAWDAYTPCEIRITAGTVVMPDGDQNLANKTITASTLDDTVIGGTTAAAGSFTDLDATTVEATNVEVTNIKANDGTAAGSIADGTGVVTVASAVLTTADINGGTVDGATIGQTTPALGTFTDMVADELQLTGGTGDQGKFTWNSDENTVDLVIDAGETLQIGQEVEYNVRNNSGSSIAKGVPVMITGTIGSSGRITIDEMDATNVANEHKYLGITAEAIASGADGKVMYFGKVKGLNTSSYSDGDLLFLDTSVVGGLTATEPSSGIKLGAAYVVHSHASAGVLMVRPSASVGLHDLHDVFVDAPGTGEIIRYNATSGLWETKTLAEAGIATTTNFTSTGIDDNATSTALTVTDSGIAATLTTAAQPNITSVGTLTGFTSTGIDDNATSTAITLNTNGKVTIDPAGSSQGTHELSVREATSPRITIDDIAGTTTDVNAGLLLRYGTTNAGSMSFGGDANLDLVNNLAGSMTFSTNSSERLRIDASGNVGIGTTSPETQFEVNADSGNSSVTIRCTNNTSQAKLRFGNSSDGDIGQIAYDHTSEYMSFTTNTSEAMRIDSSGRVGIGVSSPAEMLDINEGSTATYIRMRNATSTTGYIGYGTAASATDMTFWTNGSKQVTLDGSGNVGIGETDPDTPLHITSTAADQITLQADSTTIGPNLVFANNEGNLARIASAETNTLRFEVGPSNDTAMLINSSGEVGIGTSSPDSLLHVGTGTNTDGTDVTITIGGDTVNTRQSLITKKIQSADRALQIHAASGSSGEDIGFFSDSTTERMRIISNGRVGIGTSDPSARLHLVDTNSQMGILASSSSSTYIQFASATNTSRGFIGNGAGLVTGASNSDFIFRSQGDAVIASGGNAERMRIDTSGRVGIGRTPTDAALEVFGDSYTGFDGPANVFLYGDANYNDAGNAGAGILFGGRYTSAGAITSFAIISGIKENTNNTDFSSALTFHTRASSGTPVERMRLDSAGNVIIKPSGKLYLESSSGFSPYLAEASNALTVNTNGTERMRINSSGQVSVFAESTVSPTMEINRTALSSGDGVLLNLECNNNSGTGNILRFTNDDPTITSGNHVGEIQFFSDDAGAPNSGLVASFQVVSENSSGDSAFTWRTGGTERMRIDSNGKVFIGKSSASLSTAGFEFNPLGLQYITRSGGVGLGINRTDSNGNSVAFYRSGNTVGTISVTASATAYNTSSDVRLKENIVDAPAGNIDAIRVRSFDWKADGAHQTYGMVAQELVDVAPEAVSQGDSEDDMWAVDYSKLVPMMIKEIQDLKAEVAALKGA